MTAQNTNSVLRAAIQSLHRSIDMHIGTVKWFNNSKGYGFVIADNDTEELFAHYSTIQMDGYKSLKAGQPVRFELKQGPKGMNAVNIRPIR